MMRIFAFSSYFLPHLSGAVLVPYRLLTRLAKKNHRACVGTFRYSSTLASKEIIQGIEVKRVGYWFRISKGFFAPLVWLSLFEEVKKADVVILNQPTFEAISIAILAVRLKKPIISLYNCEVYLGAGPKNRLIVFFLNLSVAIQLFLSKKIVSYTQDYASARSLLRLFQKKVVCILPPIEKYPVSAKKYQALMGLKKNHHWIGFCGRIAREKGLEYLLDAYGRLNLADVVLVFAGTAGEEVIGEADYYKLIRTRLQKKNIPHVFLGKLTDDELGAFYKAIDVFVLPSVNKTESFGLAQAEAMIFGKPVVASDLPGVRVPISLTGLGYLVKPRDTMALVQALEKILQDRTFITEEKIRTAEQVFAVNRVYDRWEALLEDIKAEIAG